METPFFSLFFFVFKTSTFPWWRVTQILWEEIGANSGRSFPKISTSHLLREGREKERERDLGGKSIACIKLLVASKVRESFPKDNRKLLLKGGPGSRMKQRETTTEEEK